MRKYIADRLVVESQISDSAATRVAALRALADIVTVKEETKYRVDRRDSSSTTNIVVVAEALRDARQRSLES